MHDLHVLPKVRDSWSYLYVEHCEIDQHAKAVALHDTAGKTPIPCAALTLLMLGPGTSITHAATRTLAENGCLVSCHACLDRFHNERVLERMVRARATSRAYS